MARNTATTRTAAAGLTMSSGLFLDGNSANVNIPDNAAYSQPTTGELTVAFWVNPSLLQFPNEEGTSGDRYVVVCNKQGSNKNEWEFRMYGSDNLVSRGNRFSFYTFASAGGIGDGVAFQDDIVPGEWMHIAATIDSSKVMKLYKNGVLRDQFTSTVTISDTASPVRLGQGNSNSDTASSFFKGIVNDLRIYSRVLTADEVNKLSNDGSSSNTGLIGWFKLNEGSGTTATDSSTTGNNGTIAGGKYVVGLNRPRTKVAPDYTYRSSTLSNNLRPNRRQTIRSFGSKSIKFNGTSDSATDSTYIIPTAAFAMAFWIKFQTLTTNDRIFDQQDSGPANGATLSVNAGGTLGLTIRNGGTNVAGLLTDALLPHRWYHIVASYAVDNVNLYLNGVLQQTDKSATMTTPAAVFTIGKRAGAASNFFNGFLKDFMVFPRALTAGEAAALCFEGIVPTTADMYYSFDNNSNDLSGNARTLTLSGTAYASEIPLTTRLSA